MSSVSNLSFRRYPWVYLFTFLISNSIISFSHLPLGPKIHLALLGVALPLYIAFRTASSLKRSEKPGYLLDFKLSIPPWLWVLSLLSLVFLRFYKLETLFRWPTLDEGWNGTLAIELSKHWTWKFFYTFGDAPPLPVWCAALLFKLGASPAIALWLPSAVVSLLTVITGYFAAKQFTSKSFSLVCGGLLAFSYWPLFIGRFCHQGIWLPLWICLFVFLLGKYENAGGNKKFWAVGLGLGLGFGSFTFTPWLAVAAILFFWVLWKWLIHSKKDSTNVPYFIGAFLLSLIPFLQAVVREGYGHHIQSLSPWGGWFKEFQFFTNLFKYFAVMVWDSYEQTPAYTPVWGGFLNPLLGAFFFSGIIEMFRFRRTGLVQWVAAAFFLFLLPGALSPNLETFRVAQVLPLLLFITALGIHSFLQILPSKRQLTVLLLLLGVTAAFDFNLLAAPYRNPDAHPENFGRPLKSMEKYRTYKILNDYQKNHDSGYIMTNFDNNAFNDPTLLLMTRNFNFNNDPRNKALKKSGLGQIISWIAIFVDIHYQTFLESRLPNAEWFSVSKKIPGEGTRSMLGIIPKEGKDNGKWFQAHARFQQADIQRFSQNDGNMEAIIKTLGTAYPLVKGDSFLESVYWDKRAAYEYEDLNFDQQLFSYQMAVTRGYPTADLYFKLGELYRVKGRFNEARDAYLKATQAPLDLTQARAMLEWLKGQPKR